MSDTNPLPGSTGGMHPLARLIDHGETYGPHVVSEFARLVGAIGRVVDIGAGGGRDLGLVKAEHPQVRTIALEAGREYADALSAKVDEVHVLDIERDPFPFSDNSIDLIIANQILEHTKEIFWIFHQMARTLKVGGHILIGVPNILSAHNRILSIAGRHPTQHKLFSAHVRPFSKADTVKFLDACSPGTFELKAFRGSQFYPFPRSIARPLARAFPNAAFSVFFLFQKIGEYEGGFVRYPAAASLETNFYTGVADRGQYG